MQTMSAVQAAALAAPAAQRGAGTGIIKAHHNASVIPYTGIVWCMTNDKRFSSVDRAREWNHLSVRTTKVGFESASIMSEVIGVQYSSHAPRVWSWGVRDAES